MQFWILDPEWIYRKSAFSLLDTMSVYIVTIIVPIQKPMSLNILVPGCLFF